MPNVLVHVQASSWDGVGKPPQGGFMYTYRQVRKKKKWISRDNARGGTRPRYRNEGCERQSKRMMEMEGMDKHGSEKNQITSRKVVEREPFVCLPDERSPADG
jgi:hypothetical protein